MAAGSGAVLDEVSEGTYLVGLTLEETAKKYIDRGAAILDRLSAGGNQRGGRRMRGDQGCGA